MRPRLVIFQGRSRGGVGSNKVALGLPEGYAAWTMAAGMTGANGIQTTGRAFSIKGRGIAPRSNRRGGSRIKGSRPIAPYAGAHVLLSSFGNSTRTVTNASGVHEFSGGSGTNYGIGFALGAEIRVLPKLDIDLNAAYDFNTMFGGSFGTVDFNTFGFVATVLFTVN